jgi:hypothetical protein
MFLVWARYTCCYHFNDPVGFAIQDLWKEHPTKPGYWKIIGRTGAEQVTITQDGGKNNNAQLGN